MGWFWIYGALEMVVIIIIRMTITTTISTPKSKTKLTKIPRILHMIAIYNE